MLFSEELLHFIWQFRLFDPFNLKTVQGDAVQILNLGQYNRNAGPDFEFARLRIGEALWSGHVEMHVSAKEWGYHKHHLDERYNSTILHVVWEDDGYAERYDGTVLPTLRLKDFVDTAMIDKYAGLMSNLSWIPCEKYALEKVGRATSVLWAERMAIERLEYKCRHVEQLLEKNKNDWEKVLAMLLARAFGMKVNADSFEALVEKVDKSLLLRYQHDAVKLEALLFGMSGLLPRETPDAYTRTLTEEFAYLQKLHGLNNLSKLEWKFHRMRPYNFPTFRLAQFAALCRHEMYWFQKICGADMLEDVFTALREVRVNDYWLQHFRPGVTTSHHPCRLSDDFIHHIGINCFVPLLFAYGKFLGNQTYKDKALGWLQQLPAENHAISRKFSALGWKHDHAADSQGLLHMKKEYCDKRKCLSCAVGLALLKGPALLRPV